MEDLRSHLEALCCIELHTRAKQLTINSIGRQMSDSLALSVCSVISVNASCADISKNFDLLMQTEC